MRVSLISDTHGLLRPEAIAALQGSDAIIHGGDIGNVGILDALSSIAPLTAVRGNNDKGAWAEPLRETGLIRFEDVWVYVIHDLAELAIDPIAASVRVVVSGHSHKPVIEDRGGVLYVNPGSAGPRRFKLPIAVAELTIDGGTVSARIIEIA
jgi:putative phosphoesterase